MANPLLPAFNTQKLLLDDEAEYAKESPYGATQIHPTLFARSLAAVRSLLRQGNPLSGGLAKRLFAALLIGLLCILGFSKTLPVRLVFLSFGVRTAQLTRPSRLLLRPSANLLRPRLFPLLDCILQHTTMFRQHISIRSRSTLPSMTDSMPGGTPLASAGSPQTSSHGTCKPALTSFQITTKTSSQRQVSSGLS